MLFALGSSELSASALSTIRTLAERRGGYGFQLQGGYSPEGDERSNRELARARAQSVLDAFVDEGVPSERLQLLDVAATSDTVDPAKLRSCWIHPVPKDDEAP